MATKSQKTNLSSLPAELLIMILEHVYYFYIGDGRAEGNAALARSLIWEDGLPLVNTTWCDIIKTTCYNELIIHAHCIASFAQTSLLLSGFDVGRYVKKLRLVYNDEDDCYLCTRREEYWLTEFVSLDGSVHDLSHLDPPCREYWDAANMLLCECLEEIPGLASIHVDVESDDLIPEGTSNPIHDAVRRVLSLVDLEHLERIEITDYKLGDMSDFFWRGEVGMRKEQLCDNLGRIKHLKLESQSIVGNPIEETAETVRLFEKWLALIFKGLQSLKIDCQAFGYCFHPGRLLLRTSHTHLNLSSLEFYGVDFRGGLGDFFGTLTQLRRVSLRSCSIRSDRDKWSEVFLELLKRPLQLIQLHGLDYNNRRDDRRCRFAYLCSPFHEDRETFTIVRQKFRDIFQTYFFLRDCCSMHPDIKLIEEE